jgi:DNA modification methylase
MPDLLEQFGLWLGRARRGEERPSEMMGQLVSQRDASRPPHRATSSRPRTRRPSPSATSQRLIRLFTKSGQVVLDPFVGSGSTLLACEQTDRIGIGIELIERVAERDARQRLEAAR